MLQMWEQKYKTYKLSDHKDSISLDAVCVIRNYKIIFAPTQFFAGNR